MLNFIKPSIFFMALLILTLQGCSGGDKSSTTYPTTLGTSLSINSTDKNAVMLPNSNTVESISQEIAMLIKRELNSFNKKVTILTEKETNYCDISGLKESQNIATLTNITNTKNYENCQEGKTLQHGKINIDYSQMDSEKKFPKNINLTVQETYSIDHIQLKKNLSVESLITYNNDKSIKEITLKVDGEMTMDAIDYGLLNIEHTIKY